MRALITGITGFVGSHMAEYLLERGGVEVHGLVRWRSPLDNLEGCLERVRLHECELRDTHSVQKVIAAVRPDRVFHLAAQSFVPTSWHSPQDTMQNNVIGQVNIFEALLKENLTGCRVQIACSSEEYGMVHEEEAPIREENPLRPLSTYAVSKIAQDYLAYQYHQSYGLFTVRTRGFNHTGPRRGPVFVTSNFARQVAEIEAGLRAPVVRVGNLDARRDFTDVRDMVRGYWLALEKGEPGEVYNLCSGKAYSVREVLEILLGLARVEVTVEPDPERFRPSDVPLLLGDGSKFRRATGWEPLIPFETTLRDLLDYWRRRVSGPSPRR
jgi:GDP-4-dehydro-6-deoxy-D-mannose reductase